MLSAMKKERLGVTVVIHYPSNDKDCSGDYDNVTVNLDNGKNLISYGDAYHDKGYEKAFAFVDGLMHTYKVVVKEKRIADAEPWE